MLEREASSGIVYNLQLLNVFEGVIIYKFYNYFIIIFAAAAETLLPVTEFCRILSWGG